MPRRLLRMPSAPRRDAGRAWAAASSAACSCTPPSAWATSRRARPGRRPARPAGSRHHHVQTDYLDAAGLAQLARPAARRHHRIRERAGRARWRTLARARPVAPGAAAVAICQDRARGEGALRALRRALRAARGDRERRPSSPRVTDGLLPGILKTARLGYDGKGQVRVDDARRAAPPPGTACGACPACWRSCCRWPPNAR